MFFSSGFMSQAFFRDRKKVSNSSPYKTRLSNFFQFFFSKYGLLVFDPALMAIYVNGICCIPSSGQDNVLVAINISQDESFATNRRIRI